MQESNKASPVATFSYLKNAPYQNAEEKCMHCKMCRIHVMKGNYLFETGAEILFEIKVLQSVNQSQQRNLRPKCKLCHHWIHSAETDHWD